MAHPKIKISDDTGNTVNVSDIGGTNALDVNILGATISAGDLEINSEFPDAATIADNFSNPTTTSVMSMLMGYDSSGTNWNRLLTGSGVMSPSVLRITLATDDTHFGSVAAAADKEGGVHAQLHYIGNTTGALQSELESIDNRLVTEGLYTGASIPTLGSTTYTESTSMGRTIAAVRNDTLAALADTNNEFAPLQVNSTGALYTTHGMTGMAQGNTTVGTSAMQLDEGTNGYDVACKRVDLTSDPNNAGHIYVGSADTIAADGSVGGIRLNAGDFYSLDINNLTHIWVEASEAGQELNFIYYT